MSNIRVYELARDIGVTSKHLVEELRGQGINVKSHMSTLDKETADLVIELYQEESVAIAPEPKAKISPPEVVAEPQVQAAEEAVAVAEPDHPEVAEAPAAQAPAAPAANGTIVYLPEAVTVKDFAAALKLAPKDILMQLMSLGTVANINQVIDLNTATAV